MYYNFIALTYNPVVSIIILKFHLQSFDVTLIANSIFTRWYCWFNSRAGYSRRFLFSSMKNYLFLTWFPTKFLKPVNKAPHQSILQFAGEIKDALNEVTNTTCTYIWFGITRFKKWIFIGY